MKKIHLAAIGAVIIACVVLIVGGYAWFTNRSHNSAVQQNTAGPVYAYVDLEHIMMSHPEYSKYHHLELEYNAMVAQYQFEQWNYSTRAAAQDQAIKQFGSTDIMMSAALDQELKAKVALKENELNDGLQKKRMALLKAKAAEGGTSGGSSDTDLRIVNLKLKLRTEVMTEAEKKATEQELYSLMRANVPKDGSGLSDKAKKEVEAALAAEKEKAAQELAAYAAQVKEELQGRQQTSADAFGKKLDLLGNRPEPMVWNQEWKEKLDNKEKEIDAEKEIIMADIREKAETVAKEQGIEVIFSDYLGFGTAIDVTDDIIAKLA